LTALIQQLRQMKNAKENARSAPTDEALLKGTDQIFTTMCCDQFE
jgi:hypothetical protein